MSDATKPAQLYCSFCGKADKEVKKLIAGPNSFICDECVELCNDIINDGKPVESPANRKWAIEQAVKAGAENNSIAKATEILWFVYERSRKAEIARQETTA